MTDLLDLTGIITLRDKILRLLDLTVGISNGSIPDQIKAKLKRKQLMDQINECPQLKHICIFGSLSQYTFINVINKAHPEIKEYPNAKSACTFIATNFGLKLLSITDKNLQLGINSKLIDDELKIGIELHNNTGEEHTSVEEYLNAVPTNKKFKKDAGVSTFINGITDETGIPYIDQLLTNLDRSIKTDKLTLIVLTKGNISLSIILILNNPQKFSIFDSHGNTNKFCSEGASYIIYDDNNLIDTLNKYFNIEPFTEEERLDDTIRQLNQIDYTVFQL